MNQEEVTRPLNKRPIQINNILEDYSTTQTMTEKFNQLLSQAYYITKTYGVSLVQLVFMMISMAISNVYSFIFKKEKSIRDQVVLLTGSAGYLGRSLAIELAKRGAILILLDCNEVENKKTLETLNLLGCFKAHMFTADLSNETELNNVSKQIKEKFNDISMVIMAAAPRTQPKSLFELNFKDDIEQNFLVSYMSQLWLIQQFLQSMIARNAGHFVTISSSSVIFDLPLMSAYASFKLAQTKLIETAREELRANKINNVHTSIVYLTMLNGGISSDFSSSVEISDFIKPPNVEDAATAIIKGILVNKSLIFVPGIHRLLYSLKYVIPPQFLAFLYGKLFKIDSAVLKFKNK